MVELAHSMSDRNVAICLEDATKKLDATIDRVVGWQIDWREILSVQSDETVAKLKCESNGIVIAGTWRSWQVMKAEEMTLLRFKKEFGGTASFYVARKSDGAMQVIKCVRFW